MVDPQYAKAQSPNRAWKDWDSFAWLTLEGELKLTKKRQISSKGNMSRPKRSKVVFSSLLS